MYANKASRVADQPAGHRRAVTSDHRTERPSRRSRRARRRARRYARGSARPARARGTADSLAARLHDVGKTAIPASILDKPGGLNEQEWEFIGSHPVIGGRIVSAAPALADTAELIHSSHERIDGQGYPDGLTGPSIPLGSRIIAVCDAFDAMTSDRPYRQTITADAALEQLNQHAGTQFDATIVNTFCKQIAQHPAPHLTN